MSGRALPEPPQAAPGGAPPRVRLARCEYPGQRVGAVKLFTAFIPPGRGVPLDPEAQESLVGSSPPARWRKLVNIVFPHLSGPSPKPLDCPVAFSQIAEEDLRATPLPDAIPRADGTEITWTGYVQSQGWPVRRRAGR